MKDLPAARPLHARRRCALAVRP